jgi:hypothetical protein
MAVSRRALGLSAALIAALVTLAVVRSMTNSEAAFRDGPPMARGGAVAAAGADAPQAGVNVKLDALARRRVEPEDQGRNPFRFKPKPAPPAASEPRVPSNDETAGPRMPVGPPPPPPIPLKFIGIVQKADGTKIAVLSDGRRPLHGVEGQEIEGQYRIVKIGEESIEMAYLDGRGRQTIRLSGQ